MKFKAVHISLPLTKSRETALAYILQLVNCMKTSCTKYRDREHDCCVSRLILRAYVCTRAAVSLCMHMKRRHRGQHSCFFDIFIFEQICHAFKKLTAVCVCGGKSKATPKKCPVHTALVQTCGRCFGRTWLLPYNDFIRDGA